MVPRLPTRPAAAHGAGDRLPRRQVPVEKADRILLRERTGAESIPLLVAPCGEILRRRGHDPRLPRRPRNRPRRGAPPPAEGREGAPSLPGGGMRMPTTTGYTLTATTTASFADAVERVRAELKEEGFGVLCEIDVQATLREKLGVDQEPYVILGACNPPLAHEALNGRARARHAAALQRRRLRARRRDPHLGDRRRTDALDRRERRDRPVAAKVREKLAAVVDRAGSTT